MKTINLSNFGLQGVEQMSRAEMKGVVGGNMPPDLGDVVCMNIGMPQGRVSKRVILI